MICGWLSPTGEYFPCDFWEHDVLANTLAEGGTAQLESEGWLRLLASGRIRNADNPTEEQVIVLEQMLNETSSLQHLSFLVAVGEVIGKRLL